MPRVQIDSLTPTARALPQAFVQHYYQTFDTARANLVSLYRPESMLTFENEKLQGPQPIMTKLTGLPFAACQHKIDTCDAQPTMGGCILVMVSGQLVVDGEQHALKFSQVFHLANAEGSFFVLNDIFRLNYG